MKKGIIFSGVAMVLALFIFAPQAGAQMTSPYLIGEWMTAQRLWDNDYPIDALAQTQFKIQNPTTQTLDVYIVLLTRWGEVITDTYDGEPLCYFTPLGPNETWDACWPHSRPNGPDIMPRRNLTEELPNFFGTAKIFAFPYNSARTLKFDPNAIVSGYQQKSAFYPWDGYAITAATEAPLTAVTINIKTINDWTKYNLSVNTCRPGRRPFKCVINRGQWWEEQGG
jgi:hypothetical protein